MKHRVTLWNTLHAVHENSTHCVQKKTPTHVSFYISMENVQIFIKFSANV